MSIDLVLARKFTVRRPQNSNYLFRLRLAVCVTTFRRDVALYGLDRLFQLLAALLADVVELDRLCAHEAVFGYNWENEGGRGGCGQDDQDRLELHVFGG